MVAFCDERKDQLLKSLKGLAKKLLGCDVDDKKKMLTATDKCVFIDAMLNIFTKWVESVVSSDCPKKRVKRPEHRSEIVYLENFSGLTDSLEDLVDLSKRQYDLKTMFIVMRQLVCQKNVFHNVASLVFDFRELNLDKENDKFLFQIMVEIASDLGCCVVRQIIH